MPYRMFVTVSMGLVFGVLAFGAAENPLETAETLMTDGKILRGTSSLWNRC